MVSPWVAMTDPAQFIKTVDEVARLHPTVVVGGHMARLQGDRLQEAMAFLRDLPTLPMAPLPGQADLDALLLAATTGIDATCDDTVETDETALVGVGA
jgi:hypothetical protein